MLSLSYFKTSLQSPDREMILSLSYFINLQSPDSEIILSLSYFITSQQSLNQEMNPILHKAEWR